MDIDWNLITDNEFEELCGAILSKSGFYNIRNIGGSGDRGRDLVAEKDNQIAFGLKRTEKWIIQFEKAFATLQHDHLIDIESSTVVEFYDPRIREIIEDACNKNNFKLSHHTLYIYGANTGK